MDYNKGHLESMYENIQETRKERDEHIERVQKLDNDISKRLLEYRIASVDRVLVYIRDKHFTSGKNLETYLVHCMNKLHGNIDGIELTLEDVENDK